MSNDNLKNEALVFHSTPSGGNLSICLKKPLTTQKDLSLGYSPGVAYPCLEIAKDLENAYKYTSKSNFIAIISNGTAVLGLGDIGALASKPVLEGKSSLFKTFGKVDCIDITVDSKDPQEIIHVISKIANTWGGINLEDIKAPECFEIEEKLQHMLQIPIFHDDQHGTAVVVLAAIINTCKINNKNIKDIRIVINGSGAAGIACAILLKKYGIPNDNIILCDTKGVIYKGRIDGMNKYKEAHAIETKDRTLTDAIKERDVFIGLSTKNILTADMIKSMATKPVILAMANPDPEINVEFAKTIRDDLIIGTGRSDYPNQINNLLCFPYIFRGALDVRATKITDNMKIAASEALASLAEKEATEEIKKIYQGRNLVFGKDYIIPTPFDSRLLSVISSKISFELELISVSLIEFFLR